MPKKLNTEPSTTIPSALIYCEDHFAAIDGKTANGLVRHSETYEILGVIDSKQSGKDAGFVLDGEENGIRIFKSLDDACSQIEKNVSHLIFGMAPATGLLSPAERFVILAAIKRGMNVVNGLHEFLNDDAEFLAASIEHKVQLIDIRRPRPKTYLRPFSGEVRNLECIRIAVLGTDCAIGKRTTATILVRELKARGFNTVLISTGQTGLIQGARYGVALDAVPSQFCAGELEATIIEASKNENPDVIVIEGQGALSHPAYSTSSFILRGSCPQGIILQHAPGRRYRCDFEGMEMPSPASEINLIETFSETKVIGLTLNHENMTNLEIEAAVSKFESELKLPVADPLNHPPEILCQMVLAAFPCLAKSYADKQS